MKKIQSLSGMLDLFKNSDKHQSAEKIFKVEELLKLSFSSFNFSEIRTPALEETDLFKRSVSSNAGVRISEKLNELNDNFNNSSTLKNFSAD